MFFSVNKLGRVQSRQFRSKIFWLTESMGGFKPGTTNMDLLQEEADRHERIKSFLNSTTFVRSGTSVFKKCFWPLLRFMDVEEAFEMLRKWNDAEEFCKGLDAATRWGLLASSSSSSSFDHCDKTRKRGKEEDTDELERKQTTGAAITADTTIASAAIKPEAAETLSISKDRILEGAGQELRKILQLEEKFFEENDRNHSSLLGDILINKEQPNLSLSTVCGVESDDSIDNYVLLQDIQDERPVLSPNNTTLGEGDLPDLLRDKEWKIQAIVYSLIGLDGNHIIGKQAGGKPEEKEGEEAEPEPRIITTVWKHFIELSATVNARDGITSDFRISKWETARPEEDVFAKYSSMTNEDENES